MSSEIASNRHKARTIHNKHGIWQTYDGADGLPAGIMCVLQDRQGYLWLAAVHGLCRYDGINFTKYADKHGLAGINFFII